MNIAILIHLTITTMAKWVSSKLNRVFCFFLLLKDLFFLFFGFCMESNKKPTNKQRQFFLKSKKKILKFGSCLLACFIHVFFLFYCLFSAPKTQRRYVVWRCERWGRCIWKVGKMYLKGGGDVLKVGKRIDILATF